MTAEEQNEVVAAGVVVPDGHVETDKQVVPAAKRGEARDTLVARRLGQDWTQGSIIKNLLLLSWPMTITQTLNVSGSHH